MGLFDSFKKISGKVSASKVSSSRRSKRVVGLVVEAYMTKTCPEEKLKKDGLKCHFCRPNSFIQRMF